MAKKMKFGEDRCPTCGRPFKTLPQRICAKCRGQIKARHKWRFVEGRAEHRNCEKPEEFT